VSLTEKTHAGRQDHLYGLDFLRFIAAALVVVFHFGLIAHSAAARPGAGPDRMQIDAWVHFGWVGVQVFFVLSGFVIAFSAQLTTPWKFFVSRLVRLAPGVWVCAPVSLLATQLTGASTLSSHFDQFINSIVFNPFGPWIDISYWTLGIEVAFYAVVLAIIALGKSSGMRALAIVIGSLSAAFWFVSSTVGFEADLPGFASLRWFADERVSALLLIQHGCFFAVGILLWSALIAGRHALRSDLAWMSLFAVAAALQIAHQCSQYNEMLSTSHSWTVAWLFWLAALGCIVISVTGNALISHRMRPAAVMLGRMVFPLYLTNFNVSRGVLHLLGEWHVPFGLALATCFVIVLTLALVIAVMLERPLQILTRSLLTHLRPRLPAAG
jgi:peptidoglycan/LPS O-acetylase OafA/YrhL